MSRVRLDRERCVVARSHFRLEQPPTLTHIRIHTRNPQHLLTLFLAAVGRCWALFFLPANKRHRGNGTALRSLFDKRSRGADRSIDRSTDGRIEKPSAAGVGGMKKRNKRGRGSYDVGHSFPRTKKTSKFLGRPTCTPLRSFPFHAL